MRQTLVYDLRDRLRAWGTTIDFDNSILQNMYQTRCVVDAENNSYSIGAVISIIHANALYHSVMTFKPRVVLEVGMAYGASSLAILTALRDLGQNGSLISIDPFQSTHWHNIGILNIQRSNLAKSHTVIEQYDYLALPRLLEQGHSIDLAYIDGNHEFDYALLDFFYIDKMLGVGGVVAFNDCALPAVKRVLSFVRKVRAYKELDVGLKPNYLTKKHTLRNALTLTSKQDRYFQKL